MPASLPSSPMPTCRRGSLQAQSGLDHTALFKFSRLSLRSPKIKADHFLPSFNYELSSIRQTKSEKLSRKKFNSNIEDYPSLFPNPMLKGEETENLRHAANLSRSHSVKNTRENVDDSNLKRCQSEKLKANSKLASFEGSKEQTKPPPSTVPKTGVGDSQQQLSFTLGDKSGKDESIFSKFCRLSLRRNKPDTNPALLTYPSLLHLEQPPLRRSHSEKKLKFK